MKLLRTTLLAGLGAAALAATATNASAQASSVQVTNSSVTILRPIVLSKTSDLSFGTLVRPTSGSGTATISNADGSRSVTGGIAMLNTGPNAAAGRAAYTIDGEGGQAFSVTIPANFVMTRTGGAETITVTLSTSSTGGTLTGTLAGAGTGAFGVGGSMPVANTTASGAYTGTFNVVVAYN